jgi:proteic killer suppression protein
LINNFADKDLEQCWRDDRCAGLQGGLRRRVLLKLEILDIASSLEDLERIPGNRLARLHGRGAPLYTLEVDGPWQLVFRYENGACHDVWLKEVK